MDGGPAAQADDAAGDAAGGGWSRIAISRIEDLSDAVLGAGLEAMQMSRAPVTGSLAFAARDGIVYSSGSIGGRVALSGPLSDRHITLGLGLRIPAGARHWLTEVATGDFGMFLPGDEHDALYVPGSLYVTATLSGERLEELAAQAGIILDRQTLGGTGFHPRRVEERLLRDLRAGFAKLHAGAPASTRTVAVFGGRLLDLAVQHFGRLPYPVTGRANPQGYARIVARARSYIFQNLETPLSIDAIASAAFTSRRTLHRAFQTVLDETPQSFVRKLRLHRIRQDLASEVEIACTVALIANRWGMAELGRLAGWYRDLFGERPSETLAQRRQISRVAA